MLEEKTTLRTLIRSMLPRAFVSMRANSNNNNRARAAEAT